MTPDRYQRLIGLFEALCDLPAADQQARLAQVRADDAALAAELEEMLGADAEELAFMATPTLSCPVCHATFADTAEFCPNHGSRLRPAILKTDPMLGMVLDGRYRIDALMARGGMGVVYRGRQINVERDVAIKVLRQDRQHHPDVARRFAREARIIAGLRHPNTLKLIDFGYTPFDTLYIVNPLLDGRALDAVITEDGPLSVPRTLNLMRQVVSALAEAHEQGIVHRDLKPANIFVERLGGQEVFRVLDFGVAKLSVDTTDQTATGTLVGTPAYMSPEQIEADASIDGRSDLYSLGVVAYVCLTGALPWPNVTPANVAMKHLHEAPTPLTIGLPGDDVPPAVEGLIMQLLAKDPAQRPADAGALRAAIEAIERGPLATGEQPAQIIEPAAVGFGRRKVLAAMALGLLMLLGLIWVAVPSTPPRVAVLAVPDAAVPPAGRVAAAPMTAALGAAAPPPDMRVGPDAGPEVARDAGPVAPPDAGPDAARDAAPPPQPDAAVAGSSPTRRRSPRARKASTKAPRPTASPSPSPSSSPSTTYKPAPGLY